MQTTTDQLISVPAAEGDLAAAAARASVWVGEPFLRPAENSEHALAPASARRRALDEALVEMEAGRTSPSAGWRIRFGLMLGLERILSETPARLASGTELRRHQADALAGMLTELIALNEVGEARLAGANGNGNGTAELTVDEVEALEEEEDEELRSAEPAVDEVAEVQADPGAVRRFRFRHPTASGKTIAAAGFV